MRSRSLAIASASLALSVLAAGCGSDDPAPVASTPATPSAAADTPAAGGDAATSPTASASPTPSASSPGVDSPQADAIKAPKSITATVAANTDLQSLKTALGAAGLSVTLGQPGPYTVFAPSNDAFGKLGSKLDTLLQPSSKDELASILKFHVVSGEINAKDLKDGQLLTTLQGTRLRVSRKGAQVSIGNSTGKASIVTSDIDASNGVVHEIDSVLTPKKPK